MNTVLTSWADAIVDYLLAGSVTAAVLVPLAWAIIKAGRIRAPVYRHMIWQYSLIGTALLPVIWLHGPKLTVAVLSSRPEPAKVARLVETNSTNTMMSNQNLPVQPHAPRPTHIKMPHEPNTKAQAFGIKTALAGVWFVGFVFMLGRLGVGWYRLRRICSTATPVPPCEYSRNTNGQKLKVLLTSQLHGPVCFGALRPVVVLPREIYDNSLAKDIQMVLTHELAHIKRRDCWTNFSQRIIEAVFFFHPLVWLSSRQLTQQREHICDNYVLAKGVSADDYTMLLSKIGEQASRRTSLQTVALFEGQLLSRVRSLLDPVRSFETKTPRWSAITCTIAVLVGFFILGTVRLGAKPRPKTLAGPDTERIEPGKARVVHFPKNRSLGKLEIQDADAERELTYWFHWTGIKGPKWEYLCQARGDVHVPAGKRLSLFVNKTAWRDLSPLSKLRPNDLYKLSLYALPTDRAKPGDKCMPHIVHLTGLKSLALDRTNVTDRGLKYLKKLPSLEYLGMPGRVTDIGMAYVAELSSLKGLYFGSMGSRVTDAGLRHLAKLTALKELALWGEQMGDAGLIHLRDLPRLEYLFLCGSAFTDDGLVHLKDIPSLRTLSFYEGVAQITDAGLIHISDMPDLEILCLHGIRDITDDGLAHLTKMRSLRKLEIGSSQVTDRGLAHLAQIKTLERLNLPQRDQHITDEGLAYLGQLPNLKVLEVHEMHYADPSTNKEYYTDKGLAELAKCRSLENLSIGSIGITDAGLSYIAKLTNLKELNLFGCENVTDAGLAKLTSLKCLSSLHISHAKATISGINQLNSLTNLTRLHIPPWKRNGAVLNISALTNLEDLGMGFARKSGDMFTDADLMCLSNLKKLKMLQIGPRNFTDQGMTYLAQLPDIERLGIGGPGLTDQGLKYLTNMKKLDHLTISNGAFDAGKMAWGSGGNITDKGLRHLENVKLLTFLEIYSDNTFSAVAVRRLRRGLPNLYFLNINGSNSQPAGMGRRAAAVRQPRRPAAVRRSRARSSR